MPTIKTLVRANTSKAHPFTVAIVANPTLAARDGMPLRRDPILTDEPAFDAVAEYIRRSLFGQLPGQAERFLADPSVPPETNLISAFAPEVEISDATALIREDVGFSDLLVPRRERYRPFLSRLALEADVVYAVSASERLKRASAYPASDDDSAPGVQFELDGTTLFHRHFSLIPGAIALHFSATSLTAIHEFAHALSSYSNGVITDLYTDRGQGINRKEARPIPPNFCRYEGRDLASDPHRDSLGYEPGSRSFHCELNAAAPAIMDNYYHHRPSEACEHDKVTRMFLLDRVRAKMGR
jgi:hypothetical protein